MNIEKYEAVLRQKWVVEFLQEIANREKPNGDAYNIYLPHAKSVLAFLESKEYVYGMAAADAHHALTGE